MEWPSPGFWDPHTESEEEKKLKLLQMLKALPEAQQSLNFQEPPAGALNTGMEDLFKYGPGNEPAAPIPEPSYESSPLNTLLSSPELSPQERHIRGLTAYQGHPDWKLGEVPAFPDAPIPEPQAPAAAPVDAPPPGLTPEAPGLVPEAPVSQAAPRTDNRGRALALDVLSGLTEAGATINRAPSSSEIMLGLERPEGATGTAEMLSQLSGGLKAEQEQADEIDSPLVKEINKQFPDAKVKNTQEAVEYMQGKQSISNLETEKAKRGEITYKQQQKQFEAEDEQERQALLASGDLSGASEDQKKTILKEVNNWRTNPNNSDFITALSAAKKLNSLLDANNSTASRTAVTHMVKIAGDTGRLSDQDIARFQKRMGFLGITDAIHQIIFSDLNDEQKVEFRLIADEMSKLAILEIQESAQQAVGTLHGLYSELPEKALMKAFVGERFKGAGKTIRMVDPADDSNQYDVPERELEMWLKEKWVRGKDSS